MRHRGLGAPVPREDSARLARSSFRHERSKPFGGPHEVVENPKSFFAIVRPQLPHVDQNHFPDLLLKLPDLRCNRLGDTPNFRFLQPGFENDRLVPGNIPRYARGRRGCQ